MATPPPTVPPSAAAGAGAGAGASAAAAPPASGAAGRATASAVPDAPAFVGAVLCPLCTDAHTGGRPLKKRYRGTRGFYAYVIRLVSHVTSQAHHFTTRRACVHADI